jgi:hypothetical protein
MGIYDKFTDGPDQIIIEGSEIVLKMERLGNGLAKISWNIPVPPNGCPADKQAYDGIVITVNDVPSNYLSTSPVDGTYYNADSTADKDLHAADKIDTARVVGAFYHDKVTTEILVTDILDKTPYYFSGYAVDNVGRYHREGVHAYSLPTAQAENNGREDVEATHDVGIEISTPLTNNTTTGLNPQTTYTFSYTTSLTQPVKKTLSILGAEAQTYGELVKALNIEFAKAETTNQGPTFPNSGLYYVDTSVNPPEVNIWSGTENILQSPLLYSEDDPSAGALGVYWHNLSNNMLYIRDSSGWTLVPDIKWEEDPSDLPHNAVWFDGSTVYTWEDGLWCSHYTYIQSRNPLLPPVLDANTFVYRTDEGLVYQWNPEIMAWDFVNVIYSEEDPNTITSGHYWFKDDSNELYLRNGTAWQKINNVRIEEADENGEIPTPAPLVFWYDPAAQKLYRRDSGNTTWNELVVFIFPEDPTDRECCQLWWDSSVGVDTLFIWDLVNTAWINVGTFIQSASDPSLPPEIPADSAWYNPDDGTITLIENYSCQAVDNFLTKFTDPTDIPTNSAWYNLDTKVWKIWDGDSWETIETISTSFDPYVLTVGYYWFDGTTLHYWNGTGWDEITYSPDPLSVDEGYLFFNTTNNKLQQWNGSTWEVVNPSINVKIVFRNSDVAKDKLRFYTKGKGCSYFIEMDTTEGGTDNLFANLKPGIINYYPSPGKDKLETSPMWRQLGVGTDGSPDERRELHNILRNSLGAPSVRVELSKEQLNNCIDFALQKLRKRTNLTTRRVMFFLDVYPNQQMYYLTDKCVGFNKIVEVQAIYRMRGSFFNGVTGGYDLHAYGALQQLYSLGTFDMLSFHLVSAYIEELQTLFADHIMFNWDEASRELKMFKVFFRKERVLLDAVIERTEQEILKNRETVDWVRRWALAEAKMMLSQVRGKYQSYPGPNGSTTLNSQELITQSENEKADLLLELEDWIMQDAVDVGMRSHFIIG